MSHLDRLTMVNEPPDRRSTQPRSTVGDGLKANHVPQKKLLPGYGVHAQDGGAVALQRSDHMRTRAWGSRGKTTAQQDAGRPFKDVLFDDYSDLRGLGLCFDVETSIDQLTAFWINQGLFNG